uniref:Uncharacterized protein n=1 Tax=viral metagenome TaxID=1070528 RepID=A0A6C0H0I8_9ZZZZ
MNVIFTYKVCVPICTEYFYSKKKNIYNNLYAIQK